MAFPQPTMVLFDLGNVLLHIHPEAFLQSLGIDTPENRRYYQPRITRVVHQYERGADSTEQFLHNVDALFNPPEGAEQYNHGGTRLFTMDEFRAAMLSVIGQPMRGMEEMVRRVAGSVQCGLLSNTNPLHFDYCIDHYSFLRTLAPCFLSYQLKSLKPEAELFEKVLTQLQLKPAEILYIDDLPENVEASQALGFNGYRFVGPENLQQILATLRLI